MSKWSREVHLKYDPVDLARMIDFAESRDVDNHGRYRFGSVQADDDLLVLQVWSHPLGRPETRDEATRMCGYWVDFNASAIVRMFAKRPEFDFDVDVAWAELAKLEEVALGKAVYGHYDE